MMQGFGWLFAGLSGCMVVFLALDSKHPEEINKEKTYLLHEEHLYPVFDSLMLMGKDPAKSFHILHIGDSHIQGNYFTDKIRNLFYQDFGLGSKGLVFPFQLAKTNTMAEIRSSSLYPWESRRNTQALFSDQMGISGRAVINSTYHSSFNIYIPSNYKDYFFDEVTLMYTPINKTCKLFLKDSLHIHLNKIKSVEDQGFMIERFKSENLIRHLSMEIRSGQAMIHGLVFKNSTHGGVTYHVAGVNGSQYKNWASSPILAQQVSYLQPNLIILSLGTNDAYDSSMSTDEFSSHLHQLITSLKRSNPHVRFLFTTPPDSYYKRKYVNKEIDRIRHALLLYAEEHKIATWDLYAGMGGENSISTWRQQGLAAQDLIHFTKSGYEYQAELFYKSFINHYNSYVDRSN